MIQNILQGIAIGVAIVLPGLSAGTLILLLGFYRKFLDDLSRLHLRPYIFHLFGGIAGALAGARAIGYLMDHADDLLRAFLLGALVVSVRIVVSQNGKIRLSFRAVLFALVGFLATWSVVTETGLTMSFLPTGSLFHFFIGGTIASATMLLPGISGSSTLVILNLYDDVIVAVNQFQWIKLMAFAGGFLAGLFGLARLLSALYRRYYLEVSFLLAGLILGSTRALIPVQFSPLIALSAVTGALLVLLLSGKRACQPL